MDMEGYRHILPPICVFFTYTNPQPLFTIALRKSKSLVILLGTTLTLSSPIVFSTSSSFFLDLSHISF